MTASADRSPAQGGAPRVHTLGGSSLRHRHIVGSHADVGPSHDGLRCPSLAIRLWERP